ncbi:ATP-binding protein [Viridibacterium curvum]
MSRPVTGEDNLLDRLGFGVVAVHGSTIIRASDRVGRMLGQDAERLIGRDLLTLLADGDDIARLRAWLVSAYDAPVGSASRELLTRPDGMGRCWRILLHELDGGSQHTRAIVLTAAQAETAPATEVQAMELRRTVRNLLDANPVAAFLISTDHVVMHWSRACEAVVGYPASGMIGTRNHWKPFYDHAQPVLADMIVDGLSYEDACKVYPGPLSRSDRVEGGLESFSYFPEMGDGGRWLLFTAAPVRNAQGGVMGAIETVVDITEIKRAEQALRDSRNQLEELVSQRTEQLVVAKRALEEDIAKREEAEQSLRTRYTELTDLNMKLAEANAQIQAAQNQLVQNEKLASIGQLAAGVAHEINNPIGYVFSNFGSLEKYINEMLTLIARYRTAEPQISDPGLRAGLADLREKLDLDFLEEDAQALMRESREGIERVRKIVQDLKDFSHVDANSEWQEADLHQGLDSTLNIVRNELKYHAEVVREYGTLPLVHCLLSQLNQVFMNLLVNAGHALEGRQGGRIVVRTGCDQSEVWVEIEDNGCGMSEETLGRIFDPFFTTKPIGRGTGLGLSLSYGIVQKHNGRIEVDSRVGQGTRFRVVLPRRQPDEAPALQEVGV